MSAWFLDSKLSTCSYVTSVCLQVIKNDKYIFLAFSAALWEICLVSLYLFEETCTSLESPVYSDNNAFVPTL